MTPITDENKDVIAELFEHSSRFKDTDKLVSFEIVPSFGWDQQVRGSYKLSLRLHTEEKGFKRQYDSALNLRWYDSPMVCCGVSSFENFEDSDEIIELALVELEKTHCQCKGMLMATTNEEQEDVGDILKGLGYSGEQFFNPNSGNQVWLWTKKINQDKEAQNEEDYDD